MDNVGSSPAVGFRHLPGSPMTTATEVHPRDEETGTIGSATPTDEFVDEYLQEQYDVTLDEATDDRSFFERVLGM